MSSFSGNPDVDELRGLTLDVDGGDGCEVYLDELYLFAGEVTQATIEAGTRGSTDSNLLGTILIRLLKRIKRILSPMVMVQALLKRLLNLLHLPNREVRRQPQLRRFSLRLKLLRP